MGKLTDDNQQERLTELSGKPIEGELHLVGEVISGRVHRIDRHLQWLLAGEHVTPSAPPAIHDTSPEDRRQPSPLSATLLEALAALPSGSKRVLNHVFCLVPIAHHAEGHAVQGGSVFVDELIEFRRS